LPKTAISLHHVVKKVPTQLHGVVIWRKIHIIKFIKLMEYT